MNALIDLTKCREYLTITIGGKNQQVKLNGTIDDPYFCGKDVCGILGYSNIQKALFENVKPKCKQELSQLYQRKLDVETSNYLGSNQPLNYHDGKAVYISKKGLEQLVSKSRVCGPDTLQKLVESFNLDLSITPRKEHIHLEAIEQSFSEVEMFKQFKVGRYRVDLYIDEYDLVVECDEYNHRDRDPQKEKEREEFIRSELDCEFIRFNPDCKNFSIFKVIGIIHKFILERETRKLQTTIEKKNKKIKLLKAQLKED
jgi:very-short-patch-repair endonuclease